MFLLNANNFFLLVSVSLFNGISTFVGYLLPNPPLYKNSSSTIQLIAKGNKEVYTFLKGISSKVKLIA